MFQAGFADPSWYDRQISRMLDHEAIEVTWRPTAPGAAPEPLYPPGIATLFDETAVVPIDVPAVRE